MSVPHTESAVLHDELAYSDVLPITFVPMLNPPDPGIAAVWAERNLRILQTCTALEEHGNPERPDEDSPHAADILRIDLKVNLLLDLVGHLVSLSQSRPPAMPIRFNASAAVWHPGPTRPVTTGHGVLEIHLNTCVLQPLTLSGEVLPASMDIADHDTGLVEMRIDPLPVNVADELTKLIFRRHRRQVAGARGTRRMT